MPVDEDEITELLELGAEKVSGVGHPANGTPWLLLKARDVEPDPESPHVDSPEADAQEEEMTKAEADEIEALLTKELGGFCGDLDCVVCKEKFDLFPAELVEKAKLKAKARRALPTGAFALPEQRAYPIHDENHAHAALSMLHNASPKDQGRIKSAVHRKFPDIEISKEKLEKSPGVPDESVATPTEHGHLDSGQSGLAGPATGGLKPAITDPTTFAGGESTYIVLAEAGANSEVNDTPPPLDAIKDAWEIEVVEKQNWMTLDAPPVEPDEDEEDEGILGCLVAAYRAIRSVMAAQKIDPDNLTDPNDAQVWAHLEDAKATLQNAVMDQAMDITDETAMKVGARHSGQTLASLRAARDHLNELLGEGKPADTPGNGGRASEEESIMATVTKEELDLHIAEESAKAVKVALKAERKAVAKKAKAKMKMKGKMAPPFEKNANNGGDISAETMAGAVHGKHEANDINSIPDGGNVEGQYVNKQGTKNDKMLKKLLKSTEEAQGLLEKIAARPRSGGPVLDGQAHGAGWSPASEARLADGTVAKSAEESDIERLTKSLDETHDPMMKDQISRELTLAKLRYGHLTGQI